MMMYLYGSTYTKRFIYSVNRSISSLSLFFLEVGREITTSPLPERASFLCRLRDRCCWVCVLYNWRSDQTKQYHNNNIITTLSRLILFIIIIIITRKDGE